MSKTKVTLQMEQGRSLSFSELEELCDDPGRDESGQEVLAVLRPEKTGFALSVRDGHKIHRVIEKSGKQARFATIESAVDRLSDIPHLWPEVALDISRSF
jgi:hypothetical protein